jgi:septal ring factor EnvC (AmiA/AmiB activator)
LIPTVAALSSLLLLAGADTHRAQLEALRKKRASESAAAARLARKEISVLDAIADADRALQQADEESRRIQDLRAAAERSLAGSVAAEAAAQERLGARLRDLTPRLRARYRIEQWGELRPLIASASLADMVKRKYLLDRIAASDLAALAEARAAHAELVRARSEGAQQAKDLSDLAAAARARRDEASALRAERRHLLAAVRGERDLHARAASETADQERQLARFIEALPPPRSAAPGRRPPGGFASLRGRLLRPADGAVEVGFGRVVDPRWRTVTVQKGIDIRAPKGAPVRAVAAGRVAHAGWFRGYGNLIILDHGDGFHTLVAHLQSMRTAMGEEVDAGAVLGSVGESGSLKGPYLYFEIREKGRPVDPGLWLAR